MGEERTEVQRARQLLLENRKWVDLNIRDLQKKYENKWLIVRNKTVVAYGENPSELKSKVKEEVQDETLIIFVPNIIARPM